MKDIYVGTMFGKSPNPVTRKGTAESGIRCSVECKAIGSNVVMEITTHKDGGPVLEVAVINRTGNKTKLCRYLLCD